MRPPYEQLTVRMPPALRVSIVEGAKRSGRTLNDEMVARLEQASFLDGVARVVRIAIREELQADGG